MTLSKVEPSEYFSTVQFRESDLVRFRMRTSKAQLDIAVVYAADAISGYFLYLQSGGSSDDYQVQTVDFRLLRFLGIKDIRTRLGVNVPSERAPAGSSDADWAIHEQSLTTPRGRLITGLDCRQRADEFECSMYFDSFGSHSWAFRQLFVDGRVTEVSRSGSDLEYRDALTGEVIDPSDPFADRMTGV